MEFGPRALGSRSILGDPRSPRMQAQMNIKIKFREGFRPFAPSVLRDRVQDYFEMNCDSPYMLLVAPVKKERQIPMTQDQEQLWGIDKLNVPRSDLPAITHVDYSARVQTVSRDTNPDYYDLIKEFERLTGCAVVVNTSFNVRGEPIVCSPHDAFQCFMRTHIDYLVLGPFLLDKTKQPNWQETVDWKRNSHSIDPPRGAALRAHGRDGILRPGRPVLLPPPGGAGRGSRRPGRAAPPGRAPHPGPPGAGL